jgi:hypothetical protein
VRWFGSRPLELAPVAVASRTRPRRCSGPVADRPARGGPPSRARRGRPHEITGGAEVGVCPSG